MTEFYTSGGEPIQLRVVRQCLGIPDDPTESDVRRILDFMQESPYISWITGNHEEIELLRGTPGEPVPIKEPRVGLKLRWLDDFFDFEPITTSNSSMFEFCSSKP